MLDRVTAYTECFEEPQRWAIATIVSITGSSPSPVGTSMAVSADLQIIGSLSGGCVESSVAALAQDTISSGTARCESFGPDGTLFERQGLGVALTCGGQIDVVIQPLASLEPEQREQLRSLARQDPRTPAQLTRRIHADAAAELSAEAPALVIEERRDGAPLLILSGVHDVSVHLARLGLQAGWRVQMVDVRPAFATAERVPQGVELTVGEPVTVIRELLGGAGGGSDVSGAGAGGSGASGLRPWTAICVMTHHPDLDVPVLDAALPALLSGELVSAEDSSATPQTVDFLGAMGSRRAAARRAEALQERGHCEESIRAIRTPLGLDLQASTAAETAVSMFAEFIAARNSADTTARGRTAAENPERLGTPLSEQSGPVNRSRGRSISITREMAV